MQLICKYLNVSLSGVKQTLLNPSKLCCLSVRFMYYSTVICLVTDENVYSKDPAHFFTQSYVLADQRHESTNFMLKASYIVCYVRRIKAFWQHFHSKGKGFTAQSCQLENSSLTGNVVRTFWQGSLKVMSKCSSSNIILTFMECFSFYVLVELSSYVFTTCNFFSDLSKYIHK